MIICRQWYNGQSSHVFFFDSHHPPHLLDRVDRHGYPEVNLRLQGLPTKYRFQLHQEPNSIDLQDTEYDTMEKHPRE